ncbi:MAG: hypothetical protein Greene041662_616 [Candidatus Peregrinibacteria bacterium Greene0416_62]|nr:MAG: hypothetical protein Greene041662_616 [Candidatus Peregrinibacteria bacterium Greene0416_62]TSD00667.1 MAG: hypothetical protein Greene101449_41 [Candidatus Peregrinibacteria bacterium Greene1014_49]
MAHRQNSKRYERLVAAFSASAFALLVTVSTESTASTSAGLTTKTRSVIRTTPSSSVRQTTPSQPSRATATPMRESIETEETGSAYIEEYGSSYHRASPVCLCGCTTSDAGSLCPVRTENGVCPFSSRYAIAASGEDDCSEFLARSGTTCVGYDSSNATRTGTHMICSKAVLPD